jgi:predicted Fe-S protein YdhL (DUF1289 family)
MLKKNQKNKNKSPCIKQCRLDENNVCVGCGRTIDEIKQHGNDNKAGLWVTCLMK